MEAIPIGNIQSINQIIQESTILSGETDIVDQSLLRTSITVRALYAPISFFLANAKATGPPYQTEVHLFKDYTSLHNGYASTLLVIKPIILLLRSETSLGKDHIISLLGRALRGDWEVNIPAVNIADSQKKQQRTKIRNSNITQALTGSPRKHQSLIM